MWFCFPVFIFSLASQKRSLSALVVPGRVGPRHRGAWLITFSSALCWAPVSQAFQGGSSPFPLLQSSSPDSGGGSLPQQDSNAQIKISTTVRPQTHLRHYHGSRLEFMLHFIETGLSKFSETHLLLWSKARSDFIFWQPAWSGFIFLLKKLFWGLPWWSSG